MTHPPAPEGFRIGCVILGAGAGTRFGEPKAGALLQPGLRFIDAIALAARAAGIDDIVGVMHSGVAPPDGVRHVVNPNPKSEQIASLRLGLGQLVNTPARGALVWPVDHPFVLAATLTTLLDFVRKNAPLIAVPSCNGRRGHPTYFSRNVWRDLVTVQEGGARTVMHQFASEIAHITVDDPGVLRDINSPEDLTN